MDIFNNNILKRFLKILIFLTSLFYQFMVISQVIDRTVSNITLVLWILSLFFLYFAFPFSQKKDGPEKTPPSNPKTSIFVFAIILIAVVLRIGLMRDTSSFHIDEYLSAHFSYSLGNLTKLDWFSVYPPKGVWIVQFPLPYFFFQKLFFNLFGLTTMTMRLSILPYVIIIFVLLFLIAKLLYSEETGLIAITLLAVFSPDLYLSRWSLHFISSAAVFLATIYFFILSLKIGKKEHFAYFGLTLGFCYMTYYSSYVAVPLFILYILVLLFKKEIKKPTLTNLLLSLGLFVFTLSPLLTYALKVDNFFIQRTDQVKLINGQWSPYQNVKISARTVFLILNKQTGLAIRSLYTDGIGGQAGYWFGRLSLFDMLTFFFLLVSILYFTYRIFKRRETDKIFLIACLITTFITGMIFTIPPPAFHRISLIFPLITLVMAVSLSDAYIFLKKRNRFIAFTILILCILGIMAGNVVHFKKILVEDGPDDPDFPQIENNLDQEKVKMVYIAAFDSYSLGKVLFIRSRERINSLTLRLDALLPEIPKNRTSFLVIVYPDEEAIQKVKNIFPSARIYNDYRTHMLLKIN